MPATTARVERVFPFALEERTAEPGAPPRIVGHAAVFNSLSEDLGGFREEVKRGAFARAIQNGTDVRALFDHDPKYVVGRTAAGTLGLAEDHIGLRVAADPPDTTWARDMLVSMRPRRDGMRADIDQMSFAFAVVQEDKKLRQQNAEERLATGDDLPVRTIREVKLYDVSVVAFPAYHATDAAVRSVLSRVGIDFDTLAAALDHSVRRLSLTQDDVAVVRSSISALTEMLPSDSPAIAEPLGATDDSPADPAETLARMLMRLRLAEVNANTTVLS